MPPDSGEPHEFTYSTGYEGQLVQAIVEAISWVNGTDELNLKPLGDTLDVDGLQRLFTEHDGRGDFFRASADSSSDFPQVSFEYEGCLVTVYPGRFTIEPVN